MCVCVCVCVYVCMCVCVFVCVSVPQAIKNNSHEMSPETSPTAFPFLYMTFAIDIIDGGALVTKCIMIVMSYCQRRPMYVLTVYFTVKEI